jgi:hypothetical protein
MLQAHLDLENTKEVNLNDTLGQMKSVYEKKIDALIEQIIIRECMISQKGLEIE